MTFVERERVAVIKTIWGSKKTVVLLCVKKRERIERNLVQLLLVAVWVGKGAPDVGERAPSGFNVPCCLDSIQNSLVFLAHQEKCAHALVNSFTR